MAQLVINGSSYFSYATVEEADTYLFVYPDTTAWFLLDDDAKAKNLVTASAFLDGLPWRAECSPQSVRETKPSVKTAAILLANLIANGSTAFLGGTVQEAGTKRLKAGSAEIEYFANILQLTQSPGNLVNGLPPFIRSLISGCLGSTSSGISGSIAFGTDYESTAKEPWDFIR